MMFNVLPHHIHLDNDIQAPAARRWLMEDFKQYFSPQLQVISYNDDLPHISCYTLGRSPTIHQPSPCDAPPPEVQLWLPDGQEVLGEEELGSVASCNGLRDQAA